MWKNPSYMALLRPTRLLISEKYATYTIKWSYTIIWQVRVSHEHVGLEILTKIKIYILGRAKLLITVWDETPCKRTNSINEDVQLRDFWTNVNLRGEFGSNKPYGLPELNKKSLAEYLAHLAFTVTAWHELNGSVVQYGLSPKGKKTKEK